MVSVEERSVTVDGLPIHYLSAGEGPPLVLLHGAGDNALDWRWVLPALGALAILRGRSQGGGR
jgi:pimeloyl-ACP methyl ester carboxylesterase